MEGGRVRIRFLRILFFLVRSFGRLSFLGGFCRRFCFFWVIRVDLVCGWEDKWFFEFKGEIILNIKMELVILVFFCY